MLVIQTFYKAEVCDENKGHLYQCLNIRLQHQSILTALIIHGLNQNPFHPFPGSVNLVCLVCIKGRLQHIIWLCTSVYYYSNSLYVY